MKKAEETAAKTSNSAFKDGISHFFALKPKLSIE